MKQLAAWLYRTYPQNYLIRYPFRGAFIAAAFCFVFLVIYRPFEIRPSNYSLSLEATMAIYSLLITIPHIVIVPLLKRTRFFGNLHRWNIFREAHNLLKKSGVEVREVVDDGVGIWFRFF